MSVLVRLVALLLLGATTPIVVSSFSTISISSVSPFSSMVLQMSTAATVPSANAAPKLKTSLKKPSKTLTVGVEYLRGSQTALSSNELSILSMQLRKAKVSAIWCSNLHDIVDIAKEQESAKGNFPGPCPVIYDGGIEADDVIQAAIEAGAIAIAFGVDSIDAVLASQNKEGETVEIIWKVSSVEDVHAVMTATESSAEAFLFEGDTTDIADVADALPKSALLIASVDPMQRDGQEISEGRECKKSGCASILVRAACVGDSEDLEYTRHLVDGLTSKASSEFKFSGLTGSTNGHFGGVQATGSVKWRRAQ